MKTRVQKWGNSLALRIPKALAEEAGLRANAPVQLSASNGKLVVLPLDEDSLSLKELLKKVTPDNLHTAWDTGPAIGREVW
jgi:antitoxin MazE